MRWSFLSDFDFHLRLAQTEGLSVVMMSRPDCGACRQAERLLPMVLQEPLTQAVKVTHLFMVDVEESTALARAYEVFHLPSFFLFNNGKFHAEIQSSLLPEMFHQTLRDLLSKEAVEEP